MSTYIYALALTFATLVVTFRFLALSEWWARARLGLPARRILAMLLGGPFMLAAVACGSGGDEHGGGGSASFDPNIICPPAYPVLCADQYDAGNTNPAQTGLVCTDPSIDTAHCGDCRTVCSGSDICENGKCVCVPLTQKFCTNSGTTQRCGAIVDGCGHTLNCGACPSGYTCMTSGNICIVN